MKNESIPTVEDHKANGLFMQFSPKVTSMTSDFSDPEILTFEGFVIMFISHHDGEKDTFHTTFKFFNSGTKIRRSYIDLLFDDLVENKKNMNGCINSIKQQFLEWKISVDLEDSKTLILFYREEPEGDFQECFRVENFHHYINMNLNHIQMFTSMGSKYTFPIDLLELKMNEKKQRLDIDESLAISHHLAEDIFYKLNTFSKIVENDKEIMTSIHNSYSELAEKAMLLETYTRDLFRGTRKFEEHIIESLTKLKSFNPQNLPLIAKIKHILATMQYKQQKVFERFVSIKALFAARDIFQKTQNRIKKIEKVLTKLTTQIESDSFHEFFIKMQNMTEILGKLDLTSTIEGVV